MVVISTNLKFIFSSCWQFTVDIAIITISAHLRDTCISVINICYKPKVLVHFVFNQIVLSSEENNLISIHQRS